MLFQGYIDESYDDQLFTLSCVFSTVKIWSKLSHDWKLTLNSLNRKLKAQGKHAISRYHASDCSNLKREFAGWTTHDQRALFADIVRILRRYPLDTVALSVDLDDFHRVFPEARIEAEPDFETFLRGMTTKFLLNQIGGRRCSKDPNTTIALVHDRSRFDSVMLEAFNQQVNDPDFAYRYAFTTFRSVGWENCIPLQIADLLAYENFKDAMRRKYPRDRRKSLEMLLNLDSFGGRSQTMDARAIAELRAGMLSAAGRLDGRDPSTPQKFTA